jgi:hypothetical protein
MCGDHVTTLCAASCLSATRSTQSRGTRGENRLWCPHACRCAEQTSFLGVQDVFSCRPPIQPDVGRSSSGRTKSAFESAIARRPLRRSPVGDRIARLPHLVIGAGPPLNGLCEFMPRPRARCPRVNGYRAVLVIVPSDPGCCPRDRGRYVERAFVLWSSVTSTSSIAADGPRSGAETPANNQGVDVTALHRSSEGNPYGDS